MGLLGDLYSTIDSKKRQLRGLLSDPLETLYQGVRNFGAEQQGLLDMQARAYPWTGMDRNAVPDLAARKALADAGAAQGMAAATVWHGSPHKFDKFDSSKIGTGEGNQVYGHGLYFAESPDVAKGYAQNLSMRDSGQTPAQIKAAIKQTMDTMQGPLRMQKLAGLRADLEIAKQTSRAGPQTYKVDLPDEHIAKMLDWDKPLSQQPEVVKQALGGIESKFPEIADFNLRKWMDADPLASTWHNVLQRDLGADPAMITSTLKERGIPGIRYLDGGSRGAGQGSSNFVVFPGNEGLLSILERNGKPIK